jgi:hypothetical protein
VFLLETIRVGANIGPLDRVREQQGVAPGPLGTGRARACGREKFGIVHVEGGLGETQVDFPLNPVPQFTNTDGAWVFLFEDSSSRTMPWKAFA